MPLQTGSDLGLIVNMDGSPVRLRRNGRRRLKATGLYFSVKSGRHLPYESHLELHDLWRAEVDVEVLTSRPQPFTLTHMQDGELRRYTPDRLDHLAGGGRRVVEIKDRADRVSDLTAGNISEALKRRGLEFVIRCAEEIGREPAFSAVRAIQARRRTAVTVDAGLRLRDLLGGGPKPVAEALRRLSTGPCGFAELSALVVRRLVSIDLEEGLHPGALVSAVAA